jgi:hypothetical protein
MDVFMISGNRTRRERQGYRENAAMKKLAAQFLLM